MKVLSESENYKVNLNSGSCDDQDFRQLIFETLMINESLIAIKIITIIKSSDCRTNFK